MVKDEIKFSCGEHLNYLINTIGDAIIFKIKNDWRAIKCSKENCIYKARFRLEFI